MSIEPWPEGYDRILLDEVDSTNAEALRLTAQLSGPTWILAHRQTAARGRRGRPWTALSGNFFASLAMRPTGSPAEAALRSFVASLALFDAFIAVTGQGTPFALKWPNDVLLNGGKVAGILLESSAAVGGTGQNLAIGIGVNLAHAPEPAHVEARALRPVSLASETGTLIDPETFLGALAPAFAYYENQLTTYGFAALREAWLARAARLGEAIVARTGTEEIHGTFETVDEQGNLVLKTAKGRRAISAAEVYF